MAGGGGNFVEQGGGGNFVEQGGSNDDEKEKKKEKKRKNKKKRGGAGDADGGEETDAMDNPLVDDPDEVPNRLQNPLATLHEKQSNVCWMLTRLGITAATEKGQGQEEEEERQEEAGQGGDERRRRRRDGEAAEDLESPVDSQLDEHELLWLRRLACAHRLEESARCDAALPHWQPTDPEPSCAAPGELEEALDVD